MYRFAQLHIKAMALFTAVVMVFTLCLSAFATEDTAPLLDVDNIQEANTSGEATNEGEGETTSEGEGEATSEGEGETTSEGEGETTNEGEGETTNEGEGETTNEGEGGTSTEGEGETTTQGEGETTTEDESETTNEGEGETTTQGEGETTTEDEGETSTEDEGETTNEGEGETTTEVEEEETLEPQSLEEELATILEEIPIMSNSISTFAVSGYSYSDTEITNDGSLDGNIETEYYSGWYEISGLSDFDFSNYAGQTLYLKCTSDMDKSMPLIIPDNTTVMLYIPEGVTATFTAAKGVSVINESTGYVTETSACGVDIPGSASLVVVGGGTLSAVAKESYIYYPHCGTGLASIGSALSDSVGSLYLLDGSNLQAIGGVPYYRYPDSMLVAGELVNTTAPGVGMNNASYYVTLGESTVYAQESAGSVFYDSYDAYLSGESQFNFGYWSCTYQLVSDYATIEMLYASPTSATWSGLGTLTNANSKVSGQWSTNAATYYSLMNNNAIGSKNVNAYNENLGIVDFFSYPSSAYIDATQIPPLEQVTMKKGYVLEGYYTGTSGIGNKIYDENGLFVADSVEKFAASTGTTSTYSGVYPNYIETTYTVTIGNAENIASATVTVGDETFTAYNTDGASSFDVVVTGIGGDTIDATVSVTPGAGSRWSCWTDSTSTDEVSTEAQRAVSIDLWGSITLYPMVGVYQHATDTIQVPETEFENATFRSVYIQVYLNGYRDVGGTTGLLTLVNTEDSTDVLYPIVTTPPYESRTFYGYTKLEDDPDDPTIYQVCFDGAGSGLYVCFSDPDKINLDALLGTYFTVSDGTTNYLRQYVDFFSLDVTTYANGSLYNYDSVKLVGSDGDVITLDYDTTGKTETKYVMEKEYIADDGKAIYQLFVDGVLITSDNLYSSGLGTADYILFSSEKQHYGKEYEANLNETTLTTNLNGSPSAVGEVTILDAGGNQVDYTGGAGIYSVLTETSNQTYTFSVNGEVVAVLDTGQSEEIDYFSVIYEHDGTTTSGTLPATVIYKSGDTATVEQPGNLALVDDDETQFFEGWKRTNYTTGTEADYNYHLYEFGQTLVMDQAYVFQPKFEGYENADVRWTTNPDADTTWDGTTWNLDDWTYGTYSGACTVTTDTQGYLYVQFLQEKVVLESDESGTQVGELPVSEITIKANQTWEIYTQVNLVLRGAIYNYGTLYNYGQLGGISYNSTLYNGGTLENVPAGYEGDFSGGCGDVAINNIYNYIGDEQGTIIDGDFGDDDSYCYLEGGTFSGDIYLYNTATVSDFTPAEGTVFYLRYSDFTDIGNACGLLYYDQDNNAAFLLGNVAFWGTSLFGDLPFFLKSDNSCVEENGYTMEGTVRVDIEVQDGVGGQVWFTLGDLASTATTADYTLVSTSGSGVDLQAEAASGYVSRGWYQNDIGAATIVSIKEEGVYTAVFEAVDYDLSITTDPYTTLNGWYGDKTTATYDEDTEQWTISTNTAEFTVNVNATQTAEIPLGEALTLEATPAGDYTFFGYLELYGGTDVVTVAESDWNFEDSDDINNIEVSWFEGGILPDTVWEYDEDYNEVEVAYNPATHGIDLSNEEIRNVLLANGIDLISTPKDYVSKIASEVGYDFDLLALSTTTGKAIYNLNGGSWSDNSISTTLQEDLGDSATYTITAMEPEAPKTGYHFVGWHFMDDDTNIYAPGESIALTAEEQASGIVLVALYLADGDSIFFLAQSDTSGYATLDEAVVKAKSKGVDTIYVKDIGGDGTSIYGTLPNGFTLDSYTDSLMGVFIREDTRLQIGDATAGNTNAYSADWKTGATVTTNVRVRVQGGELYFDGQHSQILDKVYLESDDDVIQLLSDLHPENTLYICSNYNTLWSAANYEEGKILVASTKNYDGDDSSDEEIDDPYANIVGGKISLVDYTGSAGATVTQSTTHTTYVDVPNDEFDGYTVRLTTVGEIIATRDALFDYEVTPNYITVTEAVEDASHLTSEYDGTTDTSHNLVYLLQDTDENITLVGDDATLANGSRLVNLQPAEGVDSVQLSGNILIDSTATWNLQDQNITVTEPISIASGGLLDVTDRDFGDEIIYVQPDLTGVDLETDLLKTQKLVIIPEGTTDEETEELTETWSNYIVLPTILTDADYSLYYDDGAVWLLGQSIEVVPEAYVNIPAEIVLKDEQFTIGNMDVQDDSNLIYLDGAENLTGTFSVKTEGTFQLVWTGDEDISDYTITVYDQYKNAIENGVLMELTASNGSAYFHLSAPFRATEVDGTYQGTMVFDITYEE